MNSRHFMRLCSLSFLSLIIGGIRSQQPFDLDTSFRTSIDAWYINSILPLNESSILISGKVHFPGDPITSFRSLAKINSDGSLDTDFPQWPPGGGKITTWSDRLYVKSAHTVRRIFYDGTVDQDFIPMNLGLYFSSMQGGDYHVYSDGRILMSGLHFLEDTIRGFTGAHCLMWFSNTGYLDTTRTHRKCAGSLDFFQELPDGKFIGTLGNPPNTASWDGEPTGSNIIRLHADGAWDNTFQPHVWSGQAMGFLPLADGRIYAAGRFYVEGIPDTLHLVRFMPDGALDPTFNNTIKFRITEMTTYPYGAVPRSIYQLDEGRLIITGAFEEVESEVRKCIALVDTNGFLLDDHFVNAGVGNFLHQGSTGSVTSGIAPSPDGNWYIWGAYHGYDDGTTNDTLQRMISRLYGPHVGVEEVKEQPLLKIYPNPAQEKVVIELDPILTKGATEMLVKDMQGRSIHSRSLQRDHMRVFWDTRAVAEGAYTIMILNDHIQVASEKLIIQR